MRYQKSKRFWFEASSRGDGKIWVVVLVESLLAIRTSSHCRAGGGRLTDQLVVPPG